MNDDKLKVEIIKKLGAGLLGTAYLVKDENGDEYALKVQRVNEDELKLKTSSSLGREISFAKFASHYPEQFAQLHGYDFVKDCQYKQKPHKWFVNDLKELEKLEDKLNKHPNNKDVKKKIKEMKFISDIRERLNSKDCVRLLYDIKDGVMGTLYENYHYGKTNIAKSEMKRITYSFIAQMAYACSILEKNKYKHGDLHFWNIMYKYVPDYNTIDASFSHKTGDKIYNIPSFGYNFCMIDFGEVTHKKFDLTKSQLQWHNASKSDMVAILDYIFFMPINKTVEKKKINLLPLESLIKEIKKEPEYKETIEPLIGKTYLPFEKNILIQNTFKAINTNRFLEICGFAKHVKSINKFIHPQLIDLDDYLYCWKNLHKLENIVEHFTNKLNLL